MYLPRHFEESNREVLHELLRSHPLVWREARVDVDSLVVFQGPQAYVSPSWYPSKEDGGGKAVPSWNYVIVEARGRLRVIDDLAWLRHFVQALTQRHERHRPAPWAVSDAPAVYREKMLHAIAGIEIEGSEMRGNWKVSQNRSIADRGGTANGLRQEPAAHDKARGMVELVAPRQAT